MSQILELFQIFFWVTKTDILTHSV